MATISNTNYFSPTQISGCSLWLDAADANSVSITGGNVTLWRDKSGNLRDGTANGTISYSQNAINKLSALSFTGVTNSYISGSITITGTSFTAFAIATLDNVTCKNFARILSLGTVGINDYTSPSHSAAISRETGNQVLYTYRNGNGITPVSITYNVPFLVCVIYDGVNKTLIINSSSSNFNASTGNFNITNYEIGASFTEEATHNYGGFIGEEIIYNTTLTTNQRQQVEGYLAWKWGLQANLPTTHPYFYNPMIPNLILPAPLANPLTTTNTTLITLNPTQIAGCALWLDAADANSVSVTAGNVTAWRDKSGSGYIITATSGSQPTYTINTISFNGSQFFSTNYTSFPAAESIFIIVNQSVAVGEGNFIHPNQIGGRQLFINVSSNLETAKASQISLLSAGTISINNRILIETTNTGTSLNHFINGINQGSTTVTAYSGSLATTTIGARSSGSSAITGSINEIVIFNSALSTAQRQQIEGYLAWKWGLQASLQITHPYYYNPLIPNLILPSQVYSLAPSFSPSRFSGLGLWLDAADSASVVTSGSVVTGWRDKSTSNNSSTGVTGTVTYNSNLLNFGGGTGSSYVSIPSIAFSTTNMTFFIYLKFTSTFTYPTDANYYYVDFFNAIGATQMIYGMVRFNSSPYNWVINNYTAGGATNGQGLFYTGVGGPTGTSYIITIVTNGSTYTQYLNGNLINTTTSTSFVPTTPASFRIGTGANGMNIGEIAFFQNTTLTTNQRQQIEGYLAWKWGLQTSLPANHPYFLYPPS